MRVYIDRILHRPSNVDHKEIFTALVEFLTNEVASDMPLLWPIHPRARKQLELLNVAWKQSKRHPIDYFRRIGLKRLQP